jgi:rhodanese-related sulfurtransferase
MQEVNVLKFVTDNMYLVGIAVVSGAMLLWPVVRRGAGAGGMSPPQATLLINREDALVIDVREPAEFGKGHIINSRNVPMSQFEARAADLERYKKKPVIVTCEQGNRAGNAASMLRKRGFERVFTLLGGVSGWQQAGLPVEK